MAEFRKALPGDLPGIMTVIAQAQAFMATLGIDQWQDGYPSAEIIAEDIRLGRAYVFDDGGIIASITVLTAEPEPVYDAIDGQWRTGAPYLTIHRMALGNTHRHSGLASEILAHAKAIASAEHLTAVRADTHRGNVAMRRFLEKSGFLLCGTVEYPVDAGDPVRVAYDLIIP